MKSVMKHKFSEVPHANIPRSSFNRSHGVKTTFDAGYIVPFFVDEALPGDTFNLRTTGLARLSTPIFPTMDNMFLDTFYFAVPYRLVWDNFKKAMGEQANPGDSTDYVTPKCNSNTHTSGSYANGTLQDYLGLPTLIPGYEHSALFQRAYNLIYNEWFRDENLQNSVTVDTDDGPDDADDYSLLRRGKRHDYFTSSLPWPQKNVAGAVELPLGTQAEVHVPSHSANIEIYADNNSDYHVLENPSGTIVDLRATAAVSPVNKMYADLTTATAATINQLRQAIQIQTMYEKDARGGTRYTELVRSHFNVTSPDQRLQRPEYLGGGSTPVNITAVPVTGGGNTQAQWPDSPAGNLSAFGTATFNGHGFSKSFTEHTILLGFCNVRADLTYQQGLNRMFSRDDRLDYYWPSLAQIGEQAVLNKEIYTQGTLDTTDDDVFGYQERYAEYRYKPSTIHGVFRSNDAASLDAWHLSQDFGSLPTLSATFIEDTPPIDRIVRVTTEPDFIGDFYHHLTCARPMPLYGVPAGIMGRF